jgi:hypothetical protein
MKRGKRTARAGLLFNPKGGRYRRGVLTTAPVADDDVVLRLARLPPPGVALSSWTRLNIRSDMRPR